MIDPNSSFETIRSEVFEKMKASQFFANINARGRGVSLITDIFAKAFAHIKTKLDINRKDFFPDTAVSEEAVYLHAISQGILLSSVVAPKGFVKIETQDKIVLPEFFTFSEQNKPIVVYKTSVHRADSKFKYTLSLAEGSSFIQTVNLRVTQPSFFINDVNLDLSTLRVFGGSSDSVFTGSNELQVNTVDSLIKVRKSSREKSLISIDQKIKDQFEVLFVVAVKTNGSTNSGLSFTPSLHNWLSGYTVTEFSPVLTGGAELSIDDHILSLSKNRFTAFNTFDHFIKPTKQNFQSVNFFDSFSNTGPILNVLVINKDGTLVSPSLKRTIKTSIEANEAFGLNINLIDPILCKVGYSIIDEVTGLQKNHLYTKTGILRTVSVIELSKKYTKCLVEITSIETICQLSAYKKTVLPFAGSISGLPTTVEAKVTADSIELTSKVNQTVSFNVAPFNKSFLKRNDFVIYEV